jgi:hypothetical protein
MWDQEDNWVGLQQVRGINAEFSRVQKTGSKRYVMAPGYYGEFETVDEQELTELRPLGTFGGDTVDVTDLITPKQDRLLAREIDRIRYIAWTLVSTGTFSVSLPTGGVAHTDTYTTQTSTGSDWSTAATSTPLADFRALNTLGRGKGVSFGGRARAYMNQVTANRLMLNANAADVGGKLVTGGNNIITLDDVNRVNLANDLPQIVVHDDGYLNDAGTFVPFIADDKVVVIGARTDGGRIGEYQMTRNASNPNSAPGPYDEVIESLLPPKNIGVYRGHNGGPALFFPSAIIIMSV